LRRPLAAGIDQRSRLCGIRINRDAAAADLAGMYLTQLLYISDAVKPMKPPELQALAQDAQLNNAMLDISGVLLYGHGHFLQVLEGRLHAVNGLYARIREDRRHHRVSQLIFCPIKQRQFPDWDMHLINLDEDRSLDRRGLKRIIDKFSQVSIRQMGDIRKQALGLMDEFQRQLGNPNVQLTQQNPAGKASDSAA
jgi:hypothetical protein